MCHSCETGSINSHGYCEDCGFNEMEFINEWEEWRASMDDPAFIAEWEVWRETLAEAA